MSKLCNGCNIEKPLSDFSFRLSGKGAGKPRSRCKACEIKASREHYWRNPEYHRAYSRQWAKEHPEQVRNQHKDWRTKNAARKAETAKKWFADNADRNRENKRRWNRANPERCSQHKRKQKANNPNYAFAADMRATITTQLSVQGAKKSARGNRLLGCPLADFKRHIELLFWPGMSWNNRAEWCLDHVRPCNSFDLLQPQDQQACFHYSNYQPLWGDDNARKGARLDWTPAESRHVLPMRLLDVEDEF